MEFSDPPPHSPPQKSRRLEWPLALVLVVLLLALLTAFVFHRIETWPARNTEKGVAALEEMGRAVSEQFVRLAHLQPRVTINNRVYQEQTASIAELAVVARRVQVEHEMQHTWAGSSKLVRLHGTFLVKAGFDLRERFNVNLQPNETMIELPHARLLSVEQEKVEVLALENGYWNRVSPGDIESQLATLTQLAREQTTRDLPAAAERALARQLTEKFRPEQKVHVIFAAPAPVPHG